MALLPGRLQIWIQNIELLPGLLSPRALLISFSNDYCQRKANITADTLFYFLQRSQSEEKILRDENTQILLYF